MTCLQLEKRNENSVFKYGAGTSPLFVGYEISGSPNRNAFEKLSPSFGDLFTEGEIFDPPRNLFVEI